MNNKTQGISYILIIVIMASSIITGCGEKQGYSVLAATGTVIGVEIAQNPATQSPQAKLGYNRAELAFVPTNRSAGPNAKGYERGASDSADVIMELRYGGIFDTGESSGIYQRLAVGREAVRQPGASVMFAKDANGELKSEASAAVSQVITAQNLAESQRAATEKISDGIFKNNKADQNELTKFFQCAGFDNTRTTNLVTRYKDLSKSEFGNLLSREFGAMAPEYQNKCMK